MAASVGDASPAPPPPLPVGLAIEQAILVEETHLRGGSRPSSKEHLRPLADDEYSMAELHGGMCAYQVAGHRACEQLMHIVSITAGGSQTCAKTRLIGVTVPPLG